MTTPTPPGGNIPAGSFIGNLLGGASGTIGGTNALQESLDSLTRAVNTLSDKVSNTSFGSLGGNATAHQSRQFGSTRPFPRMFNPFQSSPPLAGIGGGGPGGAGNITPPMPFNSFVNMSGPMMMAGSLARMGQNMMPTQLSLNQYATTSMMGLNYNGMSQRQAMQALYRQAGATPGYLSSIAMSPTDMYNAMPYLQQLGGTQIIGQSALGRAGLGAMAGFGISNPTLGATTSAQFASALYSPSFSMRMLQLGYNPIRSMTGGAPMNAGYAAQSILQGMGISGMSPSRVFGNLASPKGQVSLQALFGPSGISNQAAAQYLQTYAQLFSKHMSPTAASNLIQQATFGSTSSMKAAQSRLNNLGVNTSTNDIMQLKNAQAVLSGRQSEYAGGFNDAISQSTSLLESFNNALNSLLNGPLGTATGYAGGFSGVMSGAANGAGTGFGLGAALTLGKLLRGRAGGGLLGRILGSGAAEGAAGGGILSALGSTAAFVAAPVAAGAAAWYGLQHVGGWLNSLGIHNLFGAGSSQVNQINMLKQALKRPGISSSERSQIQHMLLQLERGVSFSNNQVQHMASMGGGATPIGSSSQQRTGGRNQLGSISESARKAVGAAESQLGVPYVYGDEIPGTGFDCSGLVQWAYKQAGVGLPRRSQDMWTALKNRRVPLSQVQEGDLVFSAGSDGSASSPGHVAMMINGRQLIQAPYSGRNVEIIGYDPRGWMGAVRPSGRGSFVSGGSGGGPQIGGAGNSAISRGNRGSGGPGANSYGSAEEVDLIAAMGSGIGGFGSSFSTGNANGSSGSPNRNSSGGGSLRIPKGKAGLIALAKRIAAQYNPSWASGKQWDDFVRLENAEAGWNIHATNPKSGAYGLAQALPPDKMASVGPDWRTNPETQLRWMFGYIKGRYGSPSGAWDHEKNTNPHWYGKGGTLGPGLSIVGERGPELAMNMGGQTHIFSNAQTNYLLNAIRGNVPQNPWKTDVTSGSGSSSSHSRMINIEFKPGSIVVHSSGTHESIASKAGREVARQIVRHVNHEAVSQAIRNGEKL